MNDARAAIAATVASLRESSVVGERRIESVRRRWRGPRLQDAGELWRLGAVCVDAAGTLYATGEVVIQKRPTHPNHRSAVALRRNELRLLAQRSGIPEGTTMIIGARPLGLDAPEPPLVHTPAGLAVEWAPGAAPIPLPQYLAERAELLIHPLPGASD